MKELRKERRIRKNEEKNLSELREEWLWNERKWRNFQDHLWTQRGLFFQLLHSIRGAIYHKNDQFVHGVWKSLKIYHSTLRANVHILSGQKLIKNAKKVHFGDIWKSEACGQWVLPDISLSKKTNIGKNIKIDKFKCDILDNFQSLWNLRNKLQL